MLDRYPGWRVADVMDLTWDQIHLIWTRGKLAPKGIPVFCAADVPKAVEKLHRRKLREMGLIG